MKVGVTYKQSNFNGFYTLTRIVDFTPNRRFFKNKAKENILSNGSISNEQYIIEVLTILNYTDEELVKAIKPVIDDYINNPSDVVYEVKRYNKKLKI